MGEAVLTAVIQAACQRLIEIVVSRNNVIEAAMDMLRPDPEKYKNVLKDLTFQLVEAKKVLSDAVKQLSSQNESELVLSDAMKQLSSQNRSENVHQLLAHTVNQAADLMDEIDSRLLAKSQHLANSNIDSVFIGKIIQKLKGELKQTNVRLKDCTDKLKRVLEGSSSGGKSSKSVSTGLLTVSKVHGRDEDNTKISKFLVEKAGQKNERKIPLIAITGMAGIGKTTLAEVLYNNPHVKGRFRHKAWVDVSEDIEEFEVTKGLYNQVTGDDERSDIQDLGTLQRKLIEKLREPFLFVFDGVWNKHLDKWNELQNVLNLGTPESRIIVTTRSQEAAKSMRASRTHHLQPLSVEACWSVFANRLPGAHPTPDPTAQEEIWKKCGGLPLVARELGSLYSSVLPDQGKDILNGNLLDLSNDENKILSKMLTRFRLSFDHLSSPFLQQCFAYCSIIPKDHSFVKETLILLWMAQCFLPKPKGERTMEEVGITYFEELLQNSFFQQESDNDKSLFKMHSLINELAQSVSTIKPCLIERGKSPDFSDKTRHVSHVWDGHGKVPADLIDVLKKAKSLWTFLPSSLFSRSTSDSIGSMSMHEPVVNVLRQQRRLRVLSLCYPKSKLPKEFGELRHLRFLDLSDSAIEELPERISRLYNLQTLILSGCIHLSKLPEKMKRLTNLVHLDLTRTSVLKMMPPAFGQLKRLRILTNFVVSSSPQASSISELGELKLRGNLSILELQNVRDVQDAEKAKLKKKHVKELEFEWSSNDQHGQEQAEVLEKLCPYEDVEKLRIAGYGGTRLPTWLEESSFSKMVILRLKDCRNCSSLPSLGQLSSLQQLYVSNMPECKQWLTSGGGYPSLQELYVQNCEELTAIPNNLNSLKKLDINACRQLKFDDSRGYPNLQDLQIRSCDRLKQLTLNFYRELEFLQIHDCKNIRFLIISNNAHQDFKFLQKVEISECPSLERFYGKGLPASKLTDFSVSNCNSLCSMPKRMHTLLRSLQTLKISGCPELVSLRDVGLPQSLQKLSIHNCVKFHSMPEQMDRLLNSLQTLDILDCPKLESFPDGGLP